MKLRITIDDDAANVHKLEMIGSEINMDFGTALDVKLAVSAKPTDSSFVLLTISNPNQRQISWETK